MSSTITNLLIAIGTLLQLEAVSRPHPGQLIDLHFEEFLPADDDEDDDNDDDYDDESLIPFLVKSNFLQVWSSSLSSSHLYALSVFLPSRHTMCEG